MIPGEIFPADGDITLNAGREAVALSVANTGDRPIQVGSHYHFAETNAALDFDRAAARGRRLDIPAGTAVRFEPGQTREVRLDPLRRRPPRLRLQRQGHGRPRMTAEHHHGSCQCGAVAFDVTVDISSPIICNCSRCRRLGSVLAFAPRENFTLLRGEDALTDYTFNTRHHPPQVLQDLRHPELLLRPDARRHPDGGDQLQLPRGRRPARPARPALRRPRELSADGARDLSPGRAAAGWCADRRSPPRGRPASSSRNGRTASAAASATRPAAPPR